MSAYLVTILAQYDGIEMIQNSRTFICYSDYQLDVLLESLYMTYDESDIYIRVVPYDIEGNDPEVLIGDVEVPVNDYESGIKYYDNTEDYKNDTVINFDSIVTIEFTYYNQYLRPLGTGDQLPIYTSTGTGTIEKINNNTGDIIWTKSNANWNNFYTFHANDTGDLFASFLQINFSGGYFYYYFYGIWIDTDGNENVCFNFNIDTTSFGLFWDLWPQIGFDPVNEYFHIYVGHYPSSSGYRRYIYNKYGSLLQTVSGNSAYAIPFGCCAYNNDFYSIKRDSGIGKLYCNDSLIYTFGAGVNDYSSLTVSPGGYLYCLYGWNDDTVDLFKMTLEGSVEWIYDFGSSYFISNESEAPGHYNILSLNEEDDCLCQIADGSSNIYGALINSNGSLIWIREGTLNTIENGRSYFKDNP